MTSVLLLFYGLCAWGAACNLPAWARLFVQRLRGEHSGWSGDVYLAVRAGILLSAMGTVGLAGDRLGGELTGALPLSVPSGVGLTSIVLMALAEVLFLHAAALNARARETAAWSWRVYWMGALLWLAFVIVMG